MAYVSILGQTGGKPLKYATGTAAISGTSGSTQTLTVTGMGFRPYAVMLEAGGVVQKGFGVCNADNSVVQSIVISNTSIYTAPANFTPGDDGFTIQVKATGSSVTWTWYAIGQ